MKKVLTVILILMMLVLPVVNAHAFYGEANDYEGIFDDEETMRVQNSLYTAELVEMCVYVYQKDYQFYSDKNDIKDRGVEHVSLFIQVDSQGNYVGSSITYNERDRLLPSEGELLGYLSVARPLLKSGNYADGVCSFFDRVTDKIEANAKEAESEQEEETALLLEKEKEQQKQADAYPIYLGLGISFIVAVVIASRYIKRLTAQLKTVSYSSDAMEYVNREYIGIKCEKEEGGLWELLS